MPKTETRHRNLLKSMSLGSQCCVLRVIESPRPFYHLTSGCVHCQNRIPIRTSTNERTAAALPGRSRHPDSLPHTDTHESKLAERKPTSQQVPGIRSRFLFSLSSFSFFSCISRIQQMGVLRLGEFMGFHQRRGDAKFPLIFL